GVLGRAERGVARAADDEVAVEGAGLDRPVEEEGGGVAEVRPEAVEGGGRGDELEVGGRDEPLVGVVAVEHLAGVEILYEDAPEGVGEGVVVEDGVDAVGQLDLRPRRADGCQKREDGKDEARTTPSLGEAARRRQDGGERPAPRYALRCAHSARAHPSRHGAPAVARARSASISASGSTRRT